MVSEKQKRIISINKIYGKHGKLNEKLSKEELNFIKEFVEAGIYHESDSCKDYNYLFSKFNEIFKKLKRVNIQ